MYGMPGWSASTPSSFWSTFLDVMYVPPSIYCGGTEVGTDLRGREAPTCWSVQTSRALWAWSRPTGPAVASLGVAEMVVVQGPSWGSSFLTALLAAPLGRWLWIVDHSRACIFSSSTSFISTSLPALRSFPPHVAWLALYLHLLPAYTDKSLLGGTRTTLPAGMAEQARLCAHGTVSASHPFFLPSSIVSFLNFLLWNKFRLLRRLWRHVC